MFPTPLGPDAFNSMQQGRYAAAMQAFTTITAATCFFRFVRHTKLVVGGFFQRTPHIPHSVGSFVIKTRFAFFLVKMDLATDSGSEYDKDKKKIGFHFFLTCVTGNILKKSKMAAVILAKIDLFAYLCMYIYFEHTPTYTPIHAHVQAITMHK